MLHETIHEKSLSYRVPERLVEYARLRDLTVVSVPESYDHGTPKRSSSDQDGRPWCFRKARLPIRLN